MGMEWERYKHSTHWQYLRECKIKEVGNKCQYEGCDSKIYLEMHHLHYPDYPFEKHDNTYNVIILCNYHHSLMMHEKKPKFNKWYYITEEEAIKESNEWYKPN